MAHPRMVQRKAAKLIGSRVGFVDQTFGRKPLQISEQTSAFESGMREERFHSPISGTHDSRVRAIQSTQLDLERLERDLISISNDVEEIGNGDVRRSKKPTDRTLKNPKSWLECGEEVTRQRYSEGPCTKCYTGCSDDKISKIEACCGGSTLESWSKTIVDEVPSLPLICLSLGQLSDDTNENAAGATVSEEPGYPFLNLDNNARGSRLSKSAESRRKFRSRSRCKSVKQKKSKPHTTAKSRSISRHNVIELPPNSVLKITSRSALNVKKNRPKETVVKPKSQSPALSLKAKRVGSCPEELRCGEHAISKDHGLKQAVDPSAKTANRSNSSRYRVTPCPAIASRASTSWWSHPSSVGSTCSQPSGLSLPDTMRYRSSSARLAAARSRTTSRYKQTGSKRSRLSASRSTFSRRSSSRLRRSRHRSSGFPRDVSSDPFLDEQSAVGGRASRVSLRRRRRGRRASSPRRRKSKGSVRRHSSRMSASGAKRKRGRPRGSGKKSRSNMSVTESTQHSQGRSAGLLERVSNLWRSYSFSRSSTPAKSASSSSWVSRMLPASRSKHQNRLQRHRDKGYRYGWAHKDEAAEADRKGAEGRRKRKSAVGDSGKGRSSYCHIM